MKRALLKMIVTLIGLITVYAATQNLQSVAQSIGEQRINEQKERTKASRPKPQGGVE